MSTENIVKNQYYRILKDKANNLWERISYWTHADDVELSNGNSLTTDLADKNTKISNLFSDLAPVENSSTASQGYSKGQCLIYENRLYRVIDDILPNGTLNVGVNIELMSVSELSTMTTANTGAEFYFDIKNGTYGFYPTAEKEASSFIPFGGGGAITVATGIECTAATTTVSLVSYLSSLGYDYRNFSTNNFILEVNSVMGRGGNLSGWVGSGWKETAKSYNSSTGVLTIINGRVSQSQSGGGNATGAVKVNVLMVL